MSDRSLRQDVRNPVLALPAAERISALPDEAKAALAEIMRDLNRDARNRAQESWRRNKGPMAVYWKAVGAYAGHIYRAVRP
jgi:hypothetical protein